MDDYTKPTKRDFNPNLYKLHVGAHDVSLDDTLGVISNSIIDINLSINSIRNKLEMIVETITSFDIFLISELNVNVTFHNKQLKINKYKLFRGNRNRSGSSDGGINSLFK